MSEQKETIYIDIDDEITSIIDKVTSSNKKVVALVLPKRATVMQSIVNMRLLKRACDGAGKSIVLITSEAGVLPLAGTVGMYVAKTLQSKPAIPLVDSELDEEVVEGATDEEPEIDESTPVGELAGVAAVASLVDEETIEVDNEDKAPEVTPDTKETPKKKPKKDKKLKIPNFDSFRKKLLLGVGIVVLLGIAWYILFFVLPKATITIKTDTTTSAVDITFIASPTATTLDLENKIVPATTQKLEKTNTEKAATTGEKNLGAKAEGDVTMVTTTNCATELNDVPSGTTVSSSSLNFVTQKTAKFSPTGFEDGKCVFTSNKVGVVAEKGGGAYNLSGRAYTVAGFGSVIANGSDMSGGTDKIVKIVSQQDVDGAKTKALESNTDAVKAELSTALEKAGYLAIPETFNASQPVVTSSPAVGAEANEVSVTVVTTYTMAGAKTDDVKALVEAEAKKTIDTSKQSISNYGLDNAVYQVYEIKPDGQIRLNFKTNVTAGSQLNAEEIKKQVAGKKRGEIQEELSSIPGVTDVEVAYSPFYVTKTTSNVNKITIVIENAGQ